MNPDDFSIAIQDWASHIGFLMPGKGARTLGGDIVETIIQRIFERSKRHEDPRGNYWLEIDSDYKYRKGMYYGWGDPNFRTGQMISISSLRGRTQVNQELIMMIYGTGSPPTFSRAPWGGLKKEDRIRTDVQKAGYAQHGTTRSPARPFYGIGHGDLEAIEEAIRHAIGESVKKTKIGVWTD
jgi:hypothetical protein